MFRASKFVNKTTFADATDYEHAQGQQSTDCSLPASDADGPAVPAVEEPEVIPVESSPEAAEPAGEQVLGPIVALPAAHQLDMSVLDSLPATMRLELMREYGVHSFGAPRRTLHSKPVAAKTRSTRAGVAGRDVGGGLEGSLRRIQESGKSSKSKPKGPPPFRSIFDVPEAKNAAAPRHPVVRIGNKYMILSHLWVPGG